MAFFICLMVFIYGILEKDFWWALFSSLGAFVFFILIEILYALYLFTIVAGAMTELVNAFK